MTKEEALTLKPGDTITSINLVWLKRVVYKTEIRNDYLFWSQSPKGDFSYSNPLNNIRIVSRAEPQIINNYEVY